MAKKKVKMSESSKADQINRTRRNKIRAIEKAIEVTNNEEHIKKLNDRIQYWRDR